MGSMSRLVLASASPRRRELLAQAGFEFDVIPAHIPEEPREGEDPEAYVMRLAREKARAVFEAQAAGNREQGTGCAGAPENLVVLGADTTVTLEGHILEKPRDAEDAKRMLRMLSGRTHRVITGVAVVDAGGERVAAETTAVWFAEMTEAEIVEYVASGEPMDKAGAYGIQGRPARWIPRIEGCYFNVVGLPLALVSRMLESRQQAGGRQQATGNREQNRG